MTHKYRTTWLWILPLLLLTWWLGARGLGASAIWWDEWRTIYRAGGAQFGPLSTSEVIERMLAEDPNQSLGYPLLLNLWGRLVGWSDVAARSFSLLAGLPVIAILYRLGREMVSARVGLLAAAVIASSAFYIDYLHEMRTYSIYTLMAALAVWAYWHIISHQRLTPLSGAGLVLGVAGMLYMHYLSAVLIVGVGLYHLLFVPKNRLWWAVAGCAVLGGVLFIPWLGVMLDAVNAAVEEGGRPDVALTTWQNLDQLTYALTNGLYIFLIPVLVGVPLAILRPTVPPQKRASIFAAFAFVVTLLLTLLLHEWLTILAHARYLLVLWVLFPLLVSIGALRLLENVRYALPALVGVTLLTGAWATFAPTFSNYLLPEAYHVFFRPYLRWDDVGDTLKRQTTATDAVAVSIDRHPWAVEGAVNFYFTGMPARYTTLDALTEQGMYEFVAGAPRVWLVRELADAPNESLVQMQAILNAGYTLAETHTDNDGLAVDVFVRSLTCHTPPEKTLVRYAQPFALEAVEVFPQENALDVLTVWDVSPEVPVNTYSVAFYLMDDDNTILAQVDVPLPHDEHICHIATIPTESVPPGDYTLKTTVYAWETGERITGEHSMTGDQSDLQALAPVTVR